MDTSKAGGTGPRLEPVIGRRVAPIRWQERIADWPCQPAIQVIE
jgi:hypothetical protein